MKSLRARLTARLLIAVPILVLAAGLTSYGIARASLIHHFDAVLTAKARTIATVAEWEAPGKLELEFGDWQLPEFERKEDPEYFEVRLEGAGGIQRSHSLGDATLYSSQAAPDFLSAWNITLPDGRSGRAVALEFVARASEEEESWLAAHPPPRATLVLAASREPLDESLRAMLFGWLIVAGAIPLAAALVVGPLIGRSLRPLSDLASRAGRIEPGSTSDRFPQEGIPSELGPIVAQLNGLLGRMEQAFERERRFAADIAHELRTPIAELRTLAEVSAKWPEEPDAALRLNEDVLQIALQMERLIGTLLQLGRLRSGVQPLRKEPVELSGLIEEVWKPLAEEARKKNLKVGFEVPPEASVRSDRTALKALLSNLLTNAVEYAPDGREVDLRAQRGSPGYCLTVSNDNNSIAERDLPYLSQPLWRKDASRSDSSHSGLGLALAAGYAQLLGAKLEFGLDPLKRFAATVRLPD